MRHTDKIEIAEEQLNDNERAVLRTLRGAGGPLGLSEIGTRSFPRKADAYLLSKNALRRLVAGGFVVQVGRGTYQAKPVEPTHPCAYSACKKPLTGKKRYCGPGCRGRASEARNKAAQPELAHA